MSTPAHVKDHPIHAMLIPWPLALWILSWFADLVYLSGWGSSLWQEVAFYSMGGGLIAAVIAGVPGFLDYLSLDYSSLMDSHLKKIETWQFSFNLIIILIYAINLFMRTLDVSWEGGMALSTLGILLLGISGWLGGEIVERYGEGAGLDHILRPADKRSI